MHFICQILCCFLLSLNISSSYQPLREGDLHRCRHCRKPFTFKWNLQQHLMIMHGDDGGGRQGLEQQQADGKLECRRCRRTFVRRKFFERHVEAAKCQEWKEDGEEEET